MDTSGRTVLDPTAAAQTVKQMFGKDELAAILRFGAAELFKEDKEGGGEVRPLVHIVLSASSLIEACEDELPSCAELFKEDKHTHTHKQGGGDVSSVTFPVPVSISRCEGSRCRACGSLLWP